MSDSQIERVLGVLARRAGEDRPYRAPVFPVAVIDTVGAGDSFNAGLLAALAERWATSRDALLGLDGDEIVAVLRFASAVAALNCARAGADPPRRAEVEALLNAKSST